MLAIVNVSEDKGVPYGSGKQHYELRLNFKVLAEVEHVYEDGAAKLLRAAADALEAKEQFACQPKRKPQLPPGDLLYKALMTRSDQINRGEE